MRESVDTVHLSVLIAAVWYKIRRPRCSTCAACTRRDVDTCRDARSPRWRRAAEEVDTSFVVPTRVDFHPMRRFRWDVDVVVSVWDSTSPWHSKEQVWNGTRMRFAVITSVVVNTVRSSNRYVPSFPSLSLVFKHAQQLPCPKQKQFPRCCGSHSLGTCCCFAQLSHCGLDPVDQCFKSRAQQCCMDSNRTFCPRPCWPYCMFADEPCCL